MKLFLVFTLKTASFFKNKDAIVNGLRSHIVYEFNCGRCNKRYIGESKRHFQTRTDEHITGNPPSEISAHEHIATSSDFKILFRSRYTKIAEALFIKSCNHKENLLNEMKQQIPISVF